MTKLEQEARNAAALWLVREHLIRPSTCEGHQPPPHDLAMSLGALLVQFSRTAGAAAVDEQRGENVLANASYYTACEMVSALKREAGYEKTAIAPLDGVGVLQTILIRFAYAHAQRIEADRAVVRKGVL